MLGPSRATNPASSTPIAGVMLTAAKPTRNRHLLLLGCLILRHRCGARNRRTANRWHLPGETRLPRLYLVVKIQVANRNVVACEMRPEVTASPWQSRGQSEPSEIDQPPIDDLALVERLKARDSAAFESLYDRYVRLAFAVALRVLPDRERAEEIIQDVYVKLWRQPELYDPARGAFRPWLLRVVHHRAIDELRQASRDRTRTAADREGDLWETIADRGPAPEEIAASSIEREQILDGRRSRWRSSTD
jgi:DNA-directed RNA polymerase specialized sigma24 family protein